jgi:hypothetical protein
VGEALVAHLGRDLIFDRGLLQEARFPDGAGERLFDVDVLAALHAGEGDGGVHEIGHADGDGVDILALFLQHHAEVFVLGSLLELLEVG